MLSELHIKNFSIIETAQINFQSGFQALSGETGAGKSFLVQALQFALGARADTDAIRKGSQEATVSAVFNEIPPALLVDLKEQWDLNITDDPGTLIIRRTLQNKGRSRALVNDQAVTVKTLQNIGTRLVRHVGQFAAQELFEETFLIEALDQFGGHQKDLEAYKTALIQFQNDSHRLQELQQKIANSQEREDFLRFQLQEISGAKLKEGEEEELESQRKRLKHRAALAGHTFEMAQLLQEGEGSLTERLAQACQLAHRAQALDPSLSSLSRLLEKSLEGLEEAAVRVRDYSGDLDAPVESFDQVEGRLEKLHQLKQKYRLGIQELIAKEQQLKQDLAHLEDSEIYLEEENKKLRQAKKKLNSTAQTLRKKREQASVELSKNLKKNLKDLSLPHVQLQWNFKPFEKMEDFKGYGAEQIMLLVSFNPGEKPRPFQEVISGGELSRLFLAIHEILTITRDTPTLIFDEVDAGVSGSVAEQVGKKLARFGKKAQVLCITHLPQIASQARWQFVVEKAVRKGRTYSAVRLLKTEERVQEIARMLAGVKVTDQALRHAKELLAKSAA